MLGAGDVLSITVLGDAQLSTTAPIGPDGIISMPLVGQFLASGRTIAELKAEIETRLTTYIKNPDVTIIVTSFRPIRVAVLGAAARPGSYQLPQGSRAADAIAAAGGLADDADPAAINLALADAAVTLDYAALVSDLATNPTLTDGAVIFIPRATPRIATVLGAVARPGTYPWNREPSPPSRRSSRPPAARPATPTPAGPCSPSPTAPPNRSTWRPFRHRRARYRPNPQCDSIRSGINPQ